jgi:hypothetical protein
MAATVNLNMDQGSDFAFNILAKNANGDPANLSTGYTAYCQMRRHYSSSSYAELQTQITGGTGYIYISLGATGTAAVKPGVYFYDVELASNGGANVQRLVQGTITVYPEVTRV